MPLLAFYAKRRHFDRNGLGAPGDGGTGGAGGRGRGRGRAQVPGSRRVVIAIRFQALIVRIRLISWASSGSVNWAAASS